MAFLKLSVIPLLFLAITIAAGLDLHQLFGAESNQLCKAKIFETLKAAEQTILCDETDTSDACLVDSLRALDSVELVALRAGSSCDVAPVLSTAILAQDGCVSAIRSAAQKVHYTIIGIKSSVHKCRLTDDDGGECVPEVTITKEAIMQLEEVLSNATEQCGARSTACEQGLIAGIHHLEDAAVTATSAVSSCALSDKTVCATDITKTVKHVTRAVVDSSATAPICLFKKTAEL
ncbi:hypothetical protein CYMTET_21525 [Cymbomonas tetramitiformis]|uniref:Uncharacterized protein n=1 Tax=Cymbomonas tetramitiformis TaxID=36881 RepID=A0AAE0L337_9CHLO|nr:hypothetical protein CYMTET_21525 [Cymbomonas tetramitiformis]